MEPALVALMLAVTTAADVDSVSTTTAPPDATPMVATGSDVASADGSSGDSTAGSTAGWTAATGGLRFRPGSLPAFVPNFAPYLAKVNLFGTDCLAPGARIASDPMSDAAHAVKYALAELGIQYELKQGIAVAAMTNTQKGDSVLGAYAGELKGAWFLLQSDEAAGFLSYQVNFGTGLGSNENEQTPKRNINSQNEPGSAWFGYDVEVPDVSWGTALFDGTFVVIAGMINQTKFLDYNRYSNTRFGQMNNSSFINSKVFAMPKNDLGVALQWQPADWCYVMGSAAANNTPGGTVPWLNLESDSMTYLGEFGLIGEDVAGLGPGVLRLQPFYATNGGPTGTGISVNFEQSLGHESPWAAWGRFGVCEESVASLGGASAQASLGIAAIGLFASSTGVGERDYLGLGAGWTRSPDGALDEYVLEASYRLDLTSTVAIQPDVQWVYDPRDNAPNTDSVVFQLQLIVRW
ncbi:MAG: carbohydrate porin [Phycisphaerales bacterium]